MGARGLARIRQRLFGAALSSVACTGHEAQQSPEEPVEPPPSEGIAEPSAPTLADDGYVPGDPRTVPLPMARLPESNTTPRSITYDTWHDVHWLPSQIDGVWHADKDNSPQLAELRRILRKDDEECRLALDGVARVVEAELAGLEPVQVFIGPIDRLAFERCATTIASSGGAAVRSDDVFTVIEVDGAPFMYLAWAWLDDEVVAMLHPDRRTLEAMLVTSPDALAKNDTLLRILRRVDDSRPVWVASTRPYFDRWLGVRSQGVYFGLSTLDAPEAATPVSAVGGVLLASSRDRARAKRRARGFARVFRREVGIDLRPDVDAYDYVTFSASFTGKEFARAAKWLDAIE